MTYGNRTLAGSIGRYLTQANLAAQVGDDLALVQGAQIELLAIRKQMAVDIKTAWDTTANDSNLSADGRRNRQAELTTAAQQKAQQSVADLRQRVLAAEENIERNAARFKPKPATGVEAMLARQAAWSRLSQLLDSNRVTPRQLIEETTDPEDLFALRDELGVWVRAHGGTVDTAARITAAIDRQLASTTSPDGQAAIAAEEAVTLAMPKLRIQLGDGQRKVTEGMPSGDNLAGAIAAELAQQQAVAMRSWETQEPTTGARAQGA